MIEAIQRIPTRSVRIVSIAMVIAMVLTMFGSTNSNSVAYAKAQKTAMFGTVVSTPENGTFDVASRDGVITLTIDEKTKLTGKSMRDRLEISDIVAGMSVTGYYVEDKNRLTAGRLSFVKPVEQKSFEHVVGVVIEDTGGTLIVNTTDGEQFEITPSDNPTDDPVEAGSLIAVVVEKDPETGQLDALAVRSAQQTVDRLSAAISHEISLAQQNLLKTRMSETASVHLTRLYQTLDEIKAETQAKIEAALAEFQANYGVTLEENLLEPVLIEITGKVLAANGKTMVVAYKGNGRRTYFDVAGDVVIELFDGSISTISAVVGNYVIVTATPRTSTTDAIAHYVKVVPAPENGNSGKNKNDDTITGTIVLVENGKSDTSKIIVVEQPDGTDEVVSVTSDTVITVDGDEQGGDGLEPGQEVEITLGDDGFSADEVDAGSAGDPLPTDTPVVTPAPPVEYRIIGKVRSFDGSGVILDSVHLFLDDSSPLADPIVVGEEIELRVIVDEDGRLIIVGF